MRQGRAPYPRWRAVPVDAGRHQRTPAGPVRLDPLQVDVIVTRRASSPRMRIALRHRRHVLPTSAYKPRLYTPAVRQSRGGAGRRMLGGRGMSVNRRPDRGGPRRHAQYAADTVSARSTRSSSPHHQGRREPDAAAPRQVRREERDRRLRRRLRRRSQAARRELEIRRRLARPYPSSRPARSTSSWAP